MRPEIAALQRQIDELRQIILNHKHKGFDKTKGIAGGSDTQMQFNSNGQLAGDERLFWYAPTGALYIGDYISLPTSNAQLSITAPIGAANTVGFQAAISGGDGGAGNAAGGAASLNGGYGTGTGKGGDVSLNGGDGGDSGAEGDVIAGHDIATDAAGGFFVIPNCAGTPTGTPVNGGRNQIVYDTSADKLWIYNGAWRSVALT